MSPGLSRGSGRATHIFVAGIKQQDVDGRPSPAMTLGRRATHSGHGETALDLTWLQDFFP
jgi:hypothetical protein